MTEVAQMPAHAIWAPSSSDRWWKCNASAEAIALMPEQEEGEEARDGTAAHTEIERVLGPFGATGPITLDGDALVAAIDKDHPAAFGIAMFMRYVAKLPPGKMWVEQRVELTKDIWGRCDLGHWHEPSATLTIVDYKNGLIDVPPDKAQLKIYGGGSIFTHNLPAKWIRLVVVQPNSIMPVPRVKQHLMPVEELYAFVSELAGIPARQNKTFVAGEHCRYCPLFAKCPPTKDILAHLAVALSHNAADVPLDVRARFITMKKPIEDWFKNGEKLWTKDALGGGKIPAGMKLVTGKTNREWKDEAAARAAIYQAKGLDALSPPTVAQAEDMGIEIEGMFSKPAGGPVLAMESDKRAPWVRKSAEEMFGAALPGAT